jgi:hypothetical protein
MSKFKEYIKELQGMERITLILDLLVDKKITKEEAVVLIANDKQIKDTPTKDVYPTILQDTWVTNPYIHTGTSAATTYADTTVTTNA